MSSENGTSNGEPKEDLDAFLIEVESKLRAPFSSLDIAKAVTTTALRSSSPERYLELISKVLPRMDKVIQLRVLVGLLGLENSSAVDEVVYTDILSKLQEESTHEEWVRIMAGIVRGIMFFDPENNNESCRGEEARALLKETCKDIVQRVQTHEAETDTKDDEASLLWKADMDPLFVPYRYSLLDSKSLEQAVPECLTNPHFNVNWDADVLNLDKKLENAKAEEEEREQALMKARSKTVQPSSGAKPASRPQPPEKTTAAGSTSTTRPTTTTTGKPKAAAPKSSMFIQAKKPTMGGRGQLGRQLANMRKTGVHTRRPGSAQALVAKGRRPPGIARATAGSLRRGTDVVGGSAGRAMKYGKNKSKMKMIDVAEVEGLTKEHRERESKESKMSARKRKIMEKAEGLKKQKTEQGKSTSNNGQPAPAEPAAAESPPAKSDQALASAALLAYQQQTSTDTNHASQANDVAANAQQAAPPPVPVPSAAPQAPAAPLQDWKQLLQKSNRLSDADRLRMQQFFTDRFNPTPDVPVYRLKLHEDRSVDPSGQTVKETFYLQLDYNTFEYKMLKKMKKK